MWGNPDLNIIFGMLTIGILIVISMGLYAYNKLDAKTKKH